MTKALDMPAKDRAARGTTVPAAVSLVARLKRLAALEQAGSSQAIAADLTEPFPEAGREEAISPFELTARELERASRALATIQPTWLGAYAASAALAAGQKRTRRFWLSRLLAAGTVAIALAGLAEALQSVPAAERMRRLRTVLEDLADAKGPLAGQPVGELAPALDRLYRAIEPARTPRQFALKALPFVALMRTALPELAPRLQLAAAEQPVARLAPLLGDPVARLLDQPHWGRLAEVADALLWQAVLRHLAPATGNAPRAGTDEDALYVLDRAAARVFQVELSTRRTFSGDAAPHERVLKTLEAADPALARLYRSAAGRQRLLLQTIRNLASRRGLEAEGAEGDVVAFDAARHTLVDTGQHVPARVRLLDPPITREYQPGRRELLQKGEVEPVEDGD